jgi:hypothetical protein
MMKFDCRFVDAFGQVDFVVNKPGFPKVPLLSPRLKHRLVAGGAAAMLAFAVGLLVAVFGALAADDSVRGQPTAEQFAPPNQPDVGASEARTVDALYRQLIGSSPAITSGSRSSSRLRAAPRDDAAGSVRRWTSPR